MVLVLNSSAGALGRRLVSLFTSQCYHFLRTEMHRANRAPQFIQYTTIFNLTFFRAGQSDPRTHCTNLFHAIIINRTAFVRAHLACRGNCHFYLFTPGDSFTEATTNAQAAAHNGLKVGRFFLSRVKVTAYCCSNAKRCHER